MKGSRAALADGTLACSVSNVFEECRNVVSFGVPVEAAIAAATIQPAKAMGLEDHSWHYISASHGPPRHPPLHLPAHRLRWYASLLATTMTMEEEYSRQMMRRIRTAIEAKAEGARIWGINMEGPFFFEKASLRPPFCLLFPFYDLFSCIPRAYPYFFLISTILFH